VLFLLKLNAEGNFVWAQNFDGSSIGHSIAVDIKGDQSIYLTGEFAGTVDFDPDSLNNFPLTAVKDKDIFILKINKDGHFLWAKSMGGTETDVGWALSLDIKGSGDVYTVGQFELVADFDPGPGTYYGMSEEAHATSLFISKLDRNGQFAWAKTVGKGHGDGAFGISLDIFNTPYIVGSFYSDSLAFGSDMVVNKGHSGHDIFLAKLVGPEFTSNEDLNEIIISPNPASNELRVDFQNAVYYNVNISLYNVIGQSVYTEFHPIAYGKIELGLQNLSAAMYVVVLKIGDHKILKKIIKI
jgi:hypothetical protein